MATDNHTPIVIGAAANANMINTPLAELDAVIGDVSTLTTTATDLAAAANEHDAEIGDVSTLTTTATNLAAAVTEVDTNTDANTTEIVAARGVYADVDTRLDAISVSAGQVNTTSNGTQGTSTTLLVADGTNIIDGAWLAIVNDAGGIEYRQVSSGGGTNTIVLTVAHTGVTDGGLVSMLPASIYEASVAGPYGGTVSSPTLGDQISWSGQGRLSANAFGASSANSASVNATAINAAISAAIVLGGHTVVLPDGIVDIDSTLNLTDAEGVWLEGAGAASLDSRAGTVLNWTGGASTAIAMDGVRHCGIRNVRISDTGTGAIGVEIKYTTGSGIGSYLDTLDNVQVEGFDICLYVGATGTNCDTLSFRQCQFRTSSTNGIAVKIAASGQAKATTFVGCLFHTNATDGIGCQLVGGSTPEVVLVGCTFVVCRWALSATSSGPQFSLYGCHIEQTGQLIEILSAMSLIKVFLSGCSINQDSVISSTLTEAMTGADSTAKVADDTLWVANDGIIIESDVSGTIHAAAINTVGAALNLTIATPGGFAAAIGNLVIVPFVFVTSSASASISFFGCRIGVSGGGAPYIYVYAPSASSVIESIGCEMYGYIVSGTYRIFSPNFTNKKTVAETGLAVGNSAIASTPGTITRKIEIFDVTGASIGFLPVYDGIS